MTPTKRTLVRLPDVYAKYFKYEDEVMLARAVVKVKQAPFPKNTDTYHPLQFVACIVHSPKLKRYSFRLRPIKPHLKRESGLDKDLWFELKLKRGISPVYKKTEVNPDFMFKGKKYWLGFDFVHPGNDKKEFLHVLKESSTGRQFTHQQTDKKVIDMFVAELRVKRADLKPGKGTTNPNYL